MEREVATFLQKKYTGKLTSVESIAKEDLDLVSKINLTMHFKMWLVNVCLLLLMIQDGYFLM